MISHRAEYFRSSLFREGIYHLVGILSLGLGYLILGRWRMDWKLGLFYIPCVASKADYVLLDGSKVERISSEDVSCRHGFPEEWTIRWPLENEPEAESLLPMVGSIYFHSFTHLRVRYAYHAPHQTFIPSTYREILTKKPPSSREDARLIYGNNSSEVQVPSILHLLLTEVLHPFYVFQIASIILWSLDEYMFYAGCIFIISALSILLSLLETRRQSKALREMTRFQPNEENDELDPVHLVPGDVLVIKDNQVLPCDAVIISGSVLVNESMLTGESVPVSKTELIQQSAYDSDKHRVHTLYCGTKVLQTRNHLGPENPVEAIVVRTGFSTAKGELVRSILYPKSVDFKFYRDSIKFIGVLFGIASVGIVYCLYIMWDRPLHVLILRCLDIITIVVPPALPAAMTVGSFYAQYRLKKNSRIFCIAPQRINIGGKLKLICFDKTGTLTEDGLDFDGVVSCGSNDSKKWASVDEVTDPEVVWCLATCHSLTLINGELAGDPLDVKMFEATGWCIEEPVEDDHKKFDILTPTVIKPKNSAFVESQFDENAQIQDTLEFGIMRLFPFSSEVARMSVIVRKLGDEFFRVFVKGAPEKIIGLCNEVPLGFHENLKALTLKGYRVIALSTKELHDTKWHKIQKLKREYVESELKFLGFLVMRNNLKSESKPVIDLLTEADIRCVMVTGDNILTAISVARECGLIGPSDDVMRVEATPDKLEITPTLLNESNERSTSDGNNVIIDTGEMRNNYHFAIDGKTWKNLRLHYRALLPRFIVKGTVFARMDPEQKAQLIEEAIKIDYVVGMCGDGANDCSALKAAHVGISLSEAEASVAAPFTSAIQNITCVPTVIQEGRCSLVTSFGLFKYMALYSIVQFISVLTLYSVNSNLGDTQFLYIDLIITTTVAVLMSWTRPYPKIERKRPTGSLISGTNLFSIVSQIFVCLGVQIGAYFYLLRNNWYHPVIPNPDDEEVLCWETTTIFFVSSYQYLILAAAFSKGPPYRNPFYSNYYFLIALITLNCFTTVLGLYPGEKLAGFFELEFDPNDVKFPYRFSLLAFVVLNYVLSFFIEKVMAESFLVKKLSHKLTGKTAPKNAFKRIRSSIEEEDWPCFEGLEVKASAQEEGLRSPGVS
ncbi:polyamine-transporting ATPase 13A3 [Lepeophtheirus salmonis]|uniref:Cation-transporting ATPase n=2 Tax=Lepeophtheirus salmonis TaxID=72036 RepID=A0A0K2UL35_LEPSM|nr:probable cation-transporting ATPase 13A3 [Lepeophtheirus salmonis]XP_040581275.1 probable cation-transporting ATPase 13A3 [Lepeophtheirus salmonis]